VIDIRDPSASTEVCNFREDEEWMTPRIGHREVLHSNADASELRKKLPPFPSFLPDALLAHRGAFCGIRGAVFSTGRVIPEPSCMAPR
jgi:hypothetical protein